MSPATKTRPTKAKAAKQVEADDREPFRTIVVELELAQWRREHEELKY